MQLLDIQQIGNDVAMKWDDGSENFIAVRTLRIACPCAGCKGETDILGNVYKNPERPLPEQAFRLVRLDRVGGYAVQPLWGDGHSSGLFSFEYLRELGEAA